MRNILTGGNISGLRDSVLAHLDELYDLRLEEGEYLPRALMQLLAALSCDINREIALYITRGGEVVQVTVGTDRDVELTDYRLRRNAARLSGVRCIHTHPDGDGRLSDVDLSALKMIRFDAMTAVGVRAGAPTNVQSAFLQEGGEPSLTDPLPWYAVPDGEWLEHIRLSDRLVGWEMEETRPDRKERAVLMGLESMESLEELKRLAESAGAEVAECFLQKRPRPDTAFFVGCGRAEELNRDCQALEADLCVFDDELTSVQVKNLEQLLGIRVVDRTALILDLFAQRASSAEGRLQVELAQLKYRSAHLPGQYSALSRQAGGIGTRGPGESRLELDRRRIRERVTELRQRLDELEKQRALRRRSREKAGIPTVALVGYTNAGKSSLLNALTGAGVYAEDRLFATLDAVSRRVEPAGAPPFLLTDTVGFIRKLPHDLVSAFRSTLEEATLADVLVIVSDGASPDLVSQHDTVEQVLRDLGADHQPRVEVLNKCDLLPPDQPLPLHQAIRVSAKTGEGLTTLLRQITAALMDASLPVTLSIPFDRYGLLATLRPLGRVISETYTDTGTELTLVMAREDAEQLVRRYGADIVQVSL